MRPRPEIIVGDITTLEVDAIVNAANAALAPGGGVCGAIHRVAGGALARECRRLGGCAVGDARITGGHELPARHVIHAVGPKYTDGRHREADQLASAYWRSLEIAHEHGLTSIAFPCISTGVYGFPLEAATVIALETIGRWLETGREPSRVICCCFTEADAACYRKQG
ncbi:MAG: macro domain-containing protein [Planctomycetota bacterium]|jgi:O-acetyl-ADP-ribose deacetylase (regulator of RNase III)